MKKPFIFLFLILLLPTLSMAAQPIIQNALISPGLTIEYPKIVTFEYNKNITLNFHVYNTTGLALNGSYASCTINLYNQKNIEVFSNDVKPVKYDYTVLFNTTILNDTGDYSYIFYCNSSLVGGFISSSFRINSDGNNDSPSYFVGIIILLPMILSFLCMFGSSILGEEHTPLKIFLFYFSMIPFLLSLHLSMLSIVKFYTWPALQDVIGTTTYWYALVLFVMITYLIIYIIRKMFDQTAKQKEERLEY